MPLEAVTELTFVQLLKLQLSIISIVVVVSSVYVTVAFTVPFLAPAVKPNSVIVLFEGRSIVIGTEGFITVIFDPVMPN